MNLIVDSYIFINGVIQVVKNQLVKTSAFYLLAVFLLMNTLTAYAQVDIVNNYNEADTSGTALTDDPEKNIDKTTEFQTLGILHTALKTTCGVENCFEVKDPLSLEKLSPITRMGLVGFANNGMMSALYNQPEVDVVSHLAQEWVPGYTASNSVYAESGYEFLQGTKIIPLWNSVRSIAYVFFVLVLIVAGFMIMFRRKIGGQIAITVFNTLPNVIIGLVMATFSFALVGIMLDIGAVLTRIVAAILSDNVSGLVSVNNPFSLYSVFFDKGNAGTFWKAVLDAFGSIFDQPVDPDAGFFKAIAQKLINSAQDVSVALFTGAIGVIVLLVIVLLFLIASVKVWVTLLKAYLAILFDTVVSPLIWAFSAIPGGSGMAGQWFRRLAKNILTFPAVFLLINLGLYLLAQDISFGFPVGLSGGDLSGQAAGNTSQNFSALSNLFIRIFLPVLLMFVAAEAPKYLDDLLPSSGGKGASDAAKGVSESLKKFLPIG